MQSVSSRIHAQRRFSEPPKDVEPTSFDAAATLAGRTPVGSETMGADGKAAGILTLIGIMFTVLARFGTELGGLLHSTSPLRKVTAALLLIGFAGAALLAVVQAFRTISPRFVKGQRSLAFFAEIAAMPREEYIQRVEEMTMEQAVGQILAYNHTAAVICGEKYRQLRRALRLFEIAACSWLVLTLLLVTKSLLG